MPSNLQVAKDSANPLVNGLDRPTNAVDMGKSGFSLPFAHAFPVAPLGVAVLQDSGVEASRLLQTFKLPDQASAGMPRKPRLSKLFSLAVAPRKARL